MRKTTLLIVLLGIALIVSTIYASCGEPLLILTISTDKRVYREGEKIILNVKWKNISDKEITGSVLLFSLPAQLSISNAEKEEVVIIESFTAGPGTKPEYVTIKPKETHQLTEELPVFNYQEILKPGEYFIQKPRDPRPAGCRPPVGNVESNIIKIKVIPKLKSQSK